MSVSAQILQGPKDLYRYNLTLKDLHEFNENMDSYKELIRGVLRKEGSNLFSMIIQSDQVFMVIVISTELENEATFMYNSLTKELKILSLDSTMHVQEKIIKNTLMKRSEETITFNTLDVRFVICKIKNLFDEMGIRSFELLKGQYEQFGEFYKRARGAV